MRFIHITPEGNIIAAKQGDGMIRSDDNGENWITTQSGIFNKYLLSMKNLPNDELWVSSAGEGIFQSSDDGRHWLRIDLLDSLQDLNIESFTYFKHGSQYYQIVGTRNWGIWRFDTQWNTPRFLPTYFVWRTAHAIQTLSTGRIVVAVGSEGISYSDDNGFKWTNASGTQEDFHTNSKVVAKGTDVYVALGGQGIYKSSNYGRTWSFLGEKNPYFPVFKIFGDRLYYVVSHQIRYSDDGGASWNKLNVTDLEEPYVHEHLVRGFTFKDVYQKNNEIYVAYEFNYMWDVNSGGPDIPATFQPPTPKNKIYYSSNKGITWEILENVANNSIPFYSITKTANGNIYASTLDGEVHTSTDNGNNWTKSPKKIGDQWNDLKFLYPIGNTLYAAMEDSLMVSKNNGQTFNKVDYGMKNLIPFLGEEKKNEINGIAEVSANTYFLGLTHNFGIYKTTNSGVSFDSINNSFPCEEIRSLANNEDGDVFFATTSIWMYANPSKLSPPDLISPPDKTTNMSISLTDTEGRATAEITWGTTEKADIYEIQVSEFEQFYNFMYKKVHSGTSATLTDSLKYNTTYYWRVRSKINDSYGRWSSRWEFTTELPAPKLTYPADKQVGVPTKPVFIWEQVQDADNYLVELSSSVDFQDIVFSNTVSASTFSSATYSSPVELETYSTYHWRAKSLSSKSESRWSESNSFTTITGAPTLIYPEDNSSQIPTEISFKFKANPNTPNCYIQVSSDSTFKEVALLILNRDTESDSSHFFDFLQFYKKYYWRVQSVQIIDDGQGNKTTYKGQWSEVWSFTTGIKPPGLLSPPNNTFDVPLLTKLEWDSFDDAVGYHIQLSKDVNFEKDLLINDTLPGLTFDIPSEMLTNYELYYWRMRVILADNVAAWVSPWRFTTVMERTSTKSPDCGDVEQPLTFTIVWNKVKGASKYRIEISKGIGFNPKDIVFSKEDIGTDRILIDKGLEADSEYFGRVQGYNDNNLSDWSDVCTFSTQTLSVRNIEREFNFVAFPNPTKDKMNYEFTLANSSDVKIEIYDMSGLIVSTLCDTYLSTGRQNLSWDVNNISNGTYNLIMTVNGETYIKLVGVSK